MNRRKVLVSLMVGALGLGGIAAGTLTSQATTITVGDGELVLGDGGKIIQDNRKPKAKPTVEQAVPGGPALRVGGFLVDGTYAVTTAFADPDDRSGIPPEPVSGIITIKLQQTSTDADGRVIGKGAATIDLGEGLLTGNVIAVVKKGVLSTLNVDAKNAPKGQPSTLSYAFGFDRCSKSCAGFDNGVLTEWGFNVALAVRNTPDDDGRGDKTEFGRFNAERISD